MDKEFYKNIFTMFTGTSAAQLIWILTIPFLTRMFSADDFGIYQLFLSTTSIIIIFATARYDLAIIVPERKKQAINLMILPIIISLFISLLLIVVIITLKNFLYIFDGISLSSYIIYIPYYIMALSFYQSLYMWFVREKLFKVISIGLIIFPVLNLIFAFVFSTKFHINNALIISTILARYIEIVYFLFYFLYKNYIYIKKTNFRKLLITAKEFKDFPQYMIIGGFFDTMAASLPSYLLNLFFGTTVTGYYSLANQCLNMPISLVSKSVGDVFKQGASKIYNQCNECKEFYYKNFKLLIKLSLLISMVIFIFSPFIFKVFFGSAWELAGVYSRFLILLFIGGVVSSPLSNMYILARAQKQYIKIQILMLISNFIALIIGFYVFGNIEICLFLLGLFSFFVSCISIYFGKLLAEGKANV